MKSIGFKNFRKFEDFPSMSFAPITIFVGGNNSGKSTTVKAIISVLSFLREARLENISNNTSLLYANNFYFNQNPYAHIGTFKRAKCNKTDSNDISFDVNVEDLRFSISINGDGSDENTTYARLLRLRIEDINNRSSFEYDFQKNLCSVFFEPNVDYYENQSGYKELVRKINTYKEKSIEGDERANRMVSHLSKQLADRYPIVYEAFSLTAKVSDISGHRMVGGPLVSGLIYNTAYYFMDKDSKDDSTNVNEDDSRINLVNTYLFQLSHKVDMLLYTYPIVEYIYAHAASQIVLFTSSDNNYLSRTVHDFANRRLNDDPKVHEFMQHWMSVFGIGEDFVCNSIGGEAHTFSIVDFDTKQTPLADKGMGTIQLMILLLRIAIIISDRSVDGHIRRTTPTTVIVEEPEQNLHPKKQSQLIEFFHSIYCEYGIRFIIETHSEYLIRLSQVMVANKKYDTDEQLMRECPFKVYYFPQEGVPYDMQYQTNGRFIRGFDSGFFDEASKYAILLSKIERGRV